MDPISHAIMAAAVAELTGLDWVTVLFCATFIDLDGFLFQKKKWGRWDPFNLFHYFPVFLVLLIPMLLLRAPLFGVMPVVYAGLLGFAVHFFGEVVLDDEGWTLFPGFTVRILGARPDFIVTFRNKLFTRLDLRAIFLALGMLFVVLIYRMLSVFL